MNYNARLDSLRFFAAFTVICYHDRIFPCGWMGVHFFFVLSGFLITGLLIRSRDSTTCISDFLKYFFYRRALRILPLYFVFVLAISLFFLFTGEPASFPQASFYLYTYTLNIARILPGYTHQWAYDHLWSLSVEWQFYMLWPFVIWFVPRQWLFLTLCLLVAGNPFLRLSTGLWLSRHGFDAAILQEIFYNSTWTYFDAFALGGLLNWTRVVKFLRSPLIIRSSFALFIAAGILSILFDPSSPRTEWKHLGYGMTNYFQYAWGYSLLTLVDGCLIAMILDVSVFNPIVELPFLQYLGKISYGIYIYHTTALLIIYYLVLHNIELLFLPTGRLIKLALLLPVTGLAVLFAHFSYQYLEKPFLKLKDRAK